MKTEDEPTHGYCTVCKGPIPRGVKWTLTGLMNRVHSDPDDCIAVLRPRLYKKMMKANPGYQSRHRYNAKEVDENWAHIKSNLGW